MSDRRRAIVTEMLSLGYVREHIRGLELRGVVGVLLVYDNVERAKRDAQDAADVIEWPKSNDDMERWS